MEFIENNELNLRTSKNLLNGIYGMNSKTGGWSNDFILQNVEEKLQKYYKSKNKIIGFEHFLYCDTDSIF